MAQLTSMTGAALTEGVMLRREEQDMNSTCETFSEIDADEEWEDEEGLPIRPATSAAEDAYAFRSVSTPPPRTMPLKRRRGAHIVHGSRKQASLPPRSTIARPTRIEDHLSLSREDLVDGTLQGAFVLSRYALDVFSRAFHLLRKPLSVLLFLWLLVFIIGQFSNTLRTVVAPLCIVPGISRSSICRPRDVNAPPVSTKRPLRRADYPKLVDIQSKTLRQLMDDSVGGSALSLEIKKAEMATKDLVTLIRISKLKAKLSLASSLAEFVDDAKKTGRGLQKLTSKVGGAVDNIMAMNDYALQSIENARANEPPSWLVPVINYWNPTRPSTDAVVMKTFEEAMGVFSDNMDRLVVEAEHNLHNLNALEDRLDTIHVIISREDSSLTSEQNDLLAQLWTKLGGNRNKVQSFEKNLALLTASATYRKQALSHVVAALQTLRAMGTDMEELRDRVAAPNLIGSKVPAEVHMKSIRMGLERLLEGRVRAKRMEADAVRRALSLNGSESDDDA